MPRLRTFLAPVMSRYPAEGTGVPVRSLDPVVVNGRRLYWLDEMLEGGLEIPEDLWKTEQGSPSFVLLLTGAPGTGKTTFALELCYNLARSHPDQTPWSSLYVSGETPGNRIIDNAVCFGWDRQYFRLIRKNDNTFEWPLCNVFGSERFHASDAQPAGMFAAFVQWYQQTRPRLGLEALSKLFTGIRETLPPDVIVIDSLNLLWPQQPAPAPEPGKPASAEPQLRQARPLNLLETFYLLRNEIGGGKTSLRPKLLVFILDVVTGEATHNAWEFLADAVIRVDGAAGPEGYYSRSFQVTKIKTQTHALGNNHVYKILPQPVDSGGDVPSKPASEQPDQKDVLNRGPDSGETDSSPSFGKARTQGSPYLRSGGTFIFPSIHWHLSRSIREDPVPGFSRSENYPTGLSTLDTILGSAGAVGLGGFPSMHTTALVGERGGMKSHLAYHFMLSHALGGVSLGNAQAPKNVLLVSLRDDLDAARNTLIRLIEQQETAGPDADAEAVLTGLLRSDRLEILYNWPGCVTPDEFFHRIYVALARKRRQRPLGKVFEECQVTFPNSNSSVCTATPGRDTAEIVVLSGLDHLDVKFPLCATERVFVPALISLFRCFKVCSVVVSGEDRLGSSTDIRPLSDLILEFTTPGTPVPLVPAGTTQSSRVSAIRVPAGQIGGRWGILGRSVGGQMGFYPS